MMRHIQQRRRTQYRSAGRIAQLFLKGMCSPTPREVLACSDLSNNAVCTQNSSRPYRLRARDQVGIVVLHPSKKDAPPAACCSLSPSIASALRHFRRPHKGSSPAERYTACYETHLLATRERDEKRGWRGGEQFCHLDARAA